ncbi:MAG: ParB N-terminal domain-containing protein [Rhodobacteraceae bacterium]|nr:ParB N-terminal domain-containing protein [Paracoccaceae bacterium]
MNTIQCEKIALASTSAIRPREANARKHSQKQVAQIARSIAEHGFVNPILVDSNGTIIAGEGRWRAAQKLGLIRVPTIEITGLSEEQIRSYVIADNQLALAAEWDLEILSQELKGLEEFGVDLEVLGFGTAEIDLYLNLDRVEGEALEDELPALEPTEHAVSRVGECWRLGRHVVVCGDATDAKTFSKVLGKRRAQMVFTDPPYNVKIAGNVSGQGRVKHGEFVRGSGEMSDPEFARFLGVVFRLVADHSTDGSIHYICMDWRHIDILLGAMRQIYSRFMNLCVWNKTNAGMGSFYRSKHELIAVFKNGIAPHINNFNLGQYGRSRANVWDYAGTNSLTRERLEELAMHPTVKPVAMVADAIKDCSKRGGLILDPFCGSGSTLIAAEITGRTCAAIELDPKYVDVTIRRWQKVTGEAATHAENGKTFDQTAKSRDRYARSRGHG